MHVDSGVANPKKENVRSVLNMIQWWEMELVQSREKVKEEMLWINIDTVLLEIFKTRGVDVGLEMDKCINSKINESADGWANEVESKKEKLLALLKELELWFASLGNSLVNHQRSWAMMEIEKAWTGVLSCLWDSNEGIQFYQRLSEYLKTMKQQINDFVMWRTDEKNMLLTRIGVNPWSFWNNKAQQSQQQQQQ